MNNQQEKDGLQRLNDDQFHGSYSAIRYFCCKKKSLSSDMPYVTDVKADNKVQQPVTSKDATYWPLQISFMLALTGAILLLAGFSLAVFNISAALSVAGAALGVAGLILGLAGLIGNEVTPYFSAVSPAVLDELIKPKL